VAEFIEQIENLLLDGDVKRRRRLVAISSCGRFTIAIAIITRCRMPPRAGAGNAGALLGLGMATSRMPSTARRKLQPWKRCGASTASAI